MNKESTAVWNRAAIEEGGPGRLQGDSALAALLLLHGMVMNGGVEHAVDALSAGEFAAGLDGFRFFGFGELADLLTGAAHEDDVEGLDALYARHILSDSTIVDAFERRFAGQRTLFAPVPV